MPGNVANNPTPTTVLPWSLCASFGHSRQFAVNENEYRNGEVQVGLLVQTSRKRWTTARRLTPAVLEEFRDFYDDRKGPQEAFYFYDVFETSPKFSYDPTGAATVGRYIVRFDSPWSQVVGMGRADVQIDLIELA